MEKNSLIMRICARLGLIGEGAALIQQGKTVEDAQRLVNLERKLRRDMRKAGRLGGRWLDM